MNKPIRTIIAAFGLMSMLLVAASAATLPGPGETWTIAVGEEQTLVEGDMSAYNALAKVVVNGTLVFDDVTTAPTVVLEGTGVCQKKGDADWTMSTACGNWCGTWLFDGGVITPTVAQALGNRDAVDSKDGYSDPKSVVYFRTNATLQINVRADYLMLLQGVHLSGTGKNGQGAILVSSYISKPGTLGRITLDDDATINAQAGCYMSFDYCHFTLNGHTLTMAGTGEMKFGDGERVIGPGTIDVAAGKTVTVMTTNFQFVASNPRTQLKLHDKCNLVFCPGKKKDCPPPPQWADLHVDGSVLFNHYHDGGVNYMPTGDRDDHRLVWAGDVVFDTAGSKLETVTWISGGNPNCPVVFAGNVSGPGSMAFPNGTADSAGSYLLTGTNTYTGTTSAQLALGGALTLGGPNSIPDASKLTVRGGTVALQLGAADDDARWQPADITSFAQTVTLTKATYSDNAVISLDASTAPGGAATLDAAFWRKSGVGSTAYLGSHGGTVTVTGRLDDVDYHLAALDGTLRISGTGPVTLGESYAKSGVLGNEQGTLLFDGAKDVRFNSGSITLPHVPYTDRRNWNGERIGRLVVSNSTVTTPSLPTTEDVSSSVPKILVGASYDNDTYGYPGVAEFVDSSFTGMLRVGGGWRDKGFVFQDGGTVVNVGVFGNKSITVCGCLGYGGFSYYQLDDGLYEAQGRIESAYAQSSQHVFMQYGGTVSHTNHWASPAWTPFYYTGCGRFHHYIQSGTFQSTGSIEILKESAAGGESVITLDGPNAFLTAASGINVGNSVASTGTFILNLNDGVCAVYIARKPNAVANSYLNFNGGTLMAQSSTVLSDGQAKATVYAGGLTLDSVETLGNTSVRTPLRAPTGNGVSSIELPASLASETFLGAPLVTIAETGSGSGFGATAVALWNRSTGKVTGFKVTSAGDEYGAATATVWYGTNKTWQAVCSLAPNAKTGGLTKKGIAQAYLYVTNTYAGATVVKEGGITCACDYAIPSNTVLWLEGGNVNLASSKVALSSVGGTAGSIDSGIVRTFDVAAPLAGTTAALDFGARCSLSVTGNWTLLASDILARKTTEYKANVSFADTATLTISGFDELDTEEGRKGSPYEIFRVADGKTLEGMPTFVDPTGKGEWRLKRSGNVLKLVAARGLMMIVR